MATTISSYILTGNVSRLRVAKFEGLPPDCFSAFMKQNRDINTGSQCYQVIDKILKAAQAEAEFKAQARAQAKAQAKAQAGLQTKLRIDGIRGGVFTTNSYVYVFGSTNLHSGVRESQYFLYDTSDHFVPLGGSVMNITSPFN